MHFVGNLANLHCGDVHIPAEFADMFGVLRCIFSVRGDVAGRSLLLRYSGCDVTGALLDLDHLECNRANHACRAVG